MDEVEKVWHLSDVDEKIYPQGPVPSWNLYGEAQAFPDVMHIEDVIDRAKGLDWEIAPHRHRHLHQFFLIRAGAAQITVDGEILAPQPPFLLSIPPMAVHGLRFAAGTDGQVLTIPIVSLPEVFGQAADTAAALAVTQVCAADQAILEIFHNIKQEHDRELSARTLMLRALATQVACAVLRSLSDAPRAEGAGLPPQFLQFQSLLQIHLRAGWQVADYSRALGISPRHLSRLCHAAAGQPAAALIETAVMREACRLLVYTRMSAASVGYELGFEDPSYFSRAFKRAMGQAPSVYRAGFDRA